MLAIKTKIALGVSSLATIGGGGVALTTYLTGGNTIKDYLKEKGFTVIVNDIVAWNEVLKNYTDAIKTKPELGFGDFKGGTDKAEELKKYCDSLLNQKHTKPETSKDYKKSVWCIKEQTVSEYLKVEGHKTYNTENTSDDNYWNTKILAHSKDSTTITKITGLQLSGTNLNTSTQDDKTNIKKSCKELNSKKHYEEEFEESKSLSIFWCAS